MNSGESSRSVGAVRRLTLAAWAFAVVHALMIAFAFLASWLMPMPAFVALLIAGPCLTGVALVAAWLVRDRMHVLINGIVAACYLVVWALLYWLLQWSFR